MIKALIKKNLLLLLLVILGNLVYSQSIQQEKMKQLSFLIGEWVGTSTIYENGEMVKKVAAYERISYDLDQSILVIELNTELLQLHTIVYFDEEEKQYYYHRFSKSGAAKYPAEFKNGELIVWKNSENRFFFRSTEDGGFQEYGQKLIKGKWIKTFEDTFINTQ